MWNILVSSGFILWEITFRRAVGYSKTFFSLSDLTDIFFDMELLEFGSKSKDSLFHEEFT